MMSASAEASTSTPKKSKFLWVVLGCVVVGVGLGIVVYTQSTKPAPVVKTSPRPTSVAVASPVSTPTPAPIEINVIKEQNNSVNFPKAGKIRVYYRSLLTSWLPLHLDFESATSKKSVVLPGGSVTTPMQMSDTTITLTGPTKFKITSYLGDDSTKKSIGWIDPVANKCGANGSGTVDISPALTWAKQQAGSEPLVSQQCWGDWGKVEDASNYDFNDYYVILSYTPSTTASASPSPSTSASPSPSTAASVTPTPSSTATPTPTPSASARVSMPDTSEGTPVTGVFEVTVATVSVGLLLLVIGLFGLLVL